MATKSEVLDFIRTNYSVGKNLTNQNDLLLLNFQTGTGRKQHAFVGVDNNIMVFSPFAEVGQVSADKIFKAHDGMRHGLALIADRYCIIANCPIRDLDPSEIEAFILLTASLADEMEQKLKLGDKF